MKGKEKDEVDTVAGIGSYRILQFATKQVEDLKLSATTHNLKQNDTL